MATWILILHMLFPAGDSLQPIQIPGMYTEDATPTALDGDSDEVRYRGLEQMFARFDAEAGA